MKDAFNMWTIWYLAEKEHGSIGYEVKLSPLWTLCSVGDLHVSNVARSKSLRARCGERGHRCHGPASDRDVGLLACRPWIPWALQFKLNLGLWAYHPYLGDEIPPPIVPTSRPL